MIKLVIEKYKMRKIIKSWFVLKKDNMKMNKYIGDKSGRKYKKLKASILKIIIWSNVLKIAKSYWEIIKKNLFIKQSNEFSS